MKNAVQSALDDVTTHAIVGKNSTEVGDSVTYAGGRIRVYYDARRGGSKATRTEIRLPSGVVVTVHRNTGVASGEFFAMPLFNEVVILGSSGAVVARLAIRAEGSSPHDPLYCFYYGDTSVGLGWGQRMDLHLAEALLDERLPVSTGGDYVDQKVINWIRQKTTG